MPDLLSPILPLEADIQRDILRWLDVDNRVVWASKFNSGNLAGGFYKANYLKGCPDILGQLIDGRILAIEVKRANFVKPRPSIESEVNQAAFIKLSSSFYGVAGFVTSVRDVEALIDGAFK